MENKNFGKLFLVRGVPGSGKSTFAKKFAKENSNGATEMLHKETDQYFMVGDEYVFDPKKIKENHQLCQADVQYALRNGVDVIVSNTFVKRWELEPYLQMDYSSVSIFRMTGEFETVHAVPVEVISRMKFNFEDFKGEQFISP